MPEHDNSYRPASSLGRIKQRNRQQVKAKINSFLVWVVFFSFRISLHRLNCRRNVQLRGFHVINVKCCLHEIVNLKPIHFLRSNLKLKTRVVL